MAVIGLSLHSINAKKEPEASRQEIKVNSVPKINEVKEVSVPSLNKKVLAMSFEFSTNYNPKVGEINVGGELLYTSPEHKKILDQWKKEKKLPEKPSLEILNYLFRRCLLKASNIADDLQLPPPLPMPTIKPKQKEQEAEKKK